MPDEGIYGVFFLREGIFSEDQKKEALEYFGRYGDIQSIVPWKDGKVFVNFKFEHQAKQCIQDATNSRYGRVSRGVFTPKDTASVSSRDCKAEGRKYFNTKKKTKKWSKGNSDIKSSVPNKVENAVTKADSSSPPCVSADTECLQSTRYDDMPRLVPARSSFSSVAPQNSLRIDGMPRLVPAIKRGVKSKNGVFLRGITPSLALCALEKKYSNQIIIGNLNEMSTVEDLYEIFEALHPIYVSSVRPTNVKKKFLYCCVKFPSEREAQFAVREHHGSMLHGNYLHIEKLDEIRAECRQLKMRFNGHSSHSERFTPQIF